MLCRKINKNESLMINHKWHTKVKTNSHIKANIDNKTYKQIQ